MNELKKPKPESNRTETLRRYHNLKQDDSSSGLDGYMERDGIDGEITGDYSGESFVLSGDGTVLAVGASGNDSKGHVRIFELKNGEWAQLGQDID
jgi:hypothetical protein